MVAGRPEVAGGCTFGPVESQGSYSVRKRLALSGTLALDV